MAIPGLRERKKQRTREAIQREAMRLFQEQGYEATTIEQIAEAVEISPSTFFNYFPSKEDVVFNDPYDPLFISTFRARPSDEPLSASFRHTIVEGLAAVFERDREIILARARLTRGVPDLRARLWEEFERSQDLFCEVIAKRTGRDPYDFDLRITTMVLVSALFAAEIEWLRHDGHEDMVELVNRALDVVEAGARLDAIDTGEASLPQGRGTPRPYLGEVARSAGGGAPTGPPASAAAPHRRT
jgi:AcrR family transcriptional regulator